MVTFGKEQVCDKRAYGFIERWAIAVTDPVTTIPTLTCYHPDVLEGQFAGIAASLEKCVMRAHHEMLGFDKSLSAEDMLVDCMRLALPGSSYYVHHYDKLKQSFLARQFQIMKPGETMIDGVSRLVCNKMTLICDHKKDRGLVSFLEFSKQIADASPLLFKYYIRGEEIPPLYRLAKRQLQALNSLEDAKVIKKFVGRMQLVKFKKECNEHLLIPREYIVTRSGLRGLVTRMTSEHIFLLTEIK